ncbi:BlaI/MecI/CopY family transcriptional regulator [Kitasatospora sp. NPDC088391]|uniref:BlaI/MecI/CopY family transcriptional regulator n=1 Tax=Kitasatospora sp. NPDC088391 TaxID=3364074 RepID=UPI00382D2F98
MTDTPARRPAGELEAQVLTALWSAGTPLTPQQVQEAITADLARTTVATILARLHEKGTLSRDKTGRAFAYTPTVQDVDGLAARRMRTELDRGRDRSTVLARFVSDLSDEDERLLRDLLGEPSADAPAGPTAGPGPHRERP